ncbi:DUF2934 domain-containing protein [Caballeronia sp. KNU42]
MHNKSLEEKLRLRAYHLWEADGRPEGRSEEYWEKARVLLEQELATVIPPHEANDADEFAKQPPKKTVKAKSKATPADEGSVKTPKAKSKADAKADTKTDAKVARKTATKTEAKPKTADTDIAPKKTKTAAKPKAIAEAAEKPAKKPAVKAAAKVSKNAKK